jgi:hypothetical protein
MSGMKKLGVLVAVFALCAIGAANASAAEFTSTVAGELEVKSNAHQTFTVASGSVTCKKVVVTGKTALAAKNQHATVHYSECTAFGFPAHVSAATYDFTAGDTPAGVKNVHVKNTITISVTAGIFSCHVTVGPQFLGTVDYSSSGGNITLAPNVTGITYTTTGGACGSGGNTGKYTGSVTVGVKGGSLSYHH